MISGSLKIEFTKGVYNFSYGVGFLFVLFYLFFFLLKLLRSQPQVVHGLIPALKEVESKGSQVQGQNGQHNKIISQLNKQTV